MNGRTNSSGTTINDLEIPLDPCTNLVAVAGNGQVLLTWTDPKDKYATPEGEAMEDTDQLVSVWAYTRIVRKTGSAPASPNDGVLVVESSVRNQYQNTAYVDSGLTNDTTYYYGVFAINEDGVESEGAFENATPIAGTAVSTLAVGTLVKIKEYGSPVEYMVVHQGLPSSMYDESCDGSWVVRKDIAENRVWDSTNNDYANSDIQAYLNGAWTSRYETGILSQIKQVKIPYVNGVGTTGSVASGANGLSCKFFLLGSREVGIIEGDNLLETPADGAKLAYFDNGDQGDGVADSKRVANYNGTASAWWNRSPRQDVTNVVYCIMKAGYHGSWISNMSGGLRPACILPSTALVDETLNVIPA